MLFQTLVLFEFSIIQIHVSNLNKILNHIKQILSRFVAKYKL